MPPIILGANSALTVCAWFPSNATTGLSYKFEIGWWERQPSGVSVLLLLFNSTRTLAGIATGQGTADAELAVFRSMFPDIAPLHGIRPQRVRLLHAVAGGSAVPTAGLAQVYRLGNTAAGGARVAGILKAAKPQVNTPVVRLAIVLSEIRRLSVIGKTRVIGVAPESPVLAIAAEQRTVAVPAEYRSIAA